jgi:hypothetical protein
MEGKDRAYWLADKIPAYGDYAKEAALVLRQQADEIERLRAELIGAVTLFACHCKDATAHDWLERATALIEAPNVKCPS